MRVTTVTSFALVCDACPAAVLYAATVGRTQQCSTAADVVGVAVLLTCLLLVQNSFDFFYSTT